MTGLGFFVTVRKVAARFFEAWEVKPQKSILLQSGNRLSRNGRQAS